jgi:threonyl-tRNA synthetase
MQDAIIGTFFDNERDAEKARKDLELRTGKQHGVIGFKRDRHPLSPIGGGYIVFLVRPEKKRQSVVH